MKPSERHRQDIARLVAFREAYVRLLNSGHFQSDDFLARPEFVPSGVSIDEFNRRRSEVALAAGAAQVAFLRHGRLMTLRNAAYITNNVDVVSNWEMSLREPNNLPPEWVLNVTENAIGSATTRAEEAADREQGIVGV